MSTFAFIEAEKANFPISFMCALLGVSRAGFYAWRARRPSTRDRADARLLSLVRAVHARSRGTYGAPRVHAELRAVHAVRCGRKRVARLMRAAGLAGVHRRRRTGLTCRDPAATPSPDRVKRNFTPDRPNKLWVADITQQRTGQGWFYLAVIVDAYSRRVVGWAMAEHVRTGLVLDALSMAITARRPPPGLVHHSDHGAQGGFNWSSQHLECGGVDGSAGGVDEGVDGQVADEVAGEAVASAGCRALVLA